jgi:hypothetical protein
MVRAYVEQLLEQLTGIEKAVPDPDGDYPVRVSNALFYVRLIGDTADPVVQVFATAVSEVKASPELFERINDINSSIRFARVFWVRDQVLVESDLLGNTIDPPEFHGACRAVAAITDHFGASLAKEFGGKAFFEEQKAAEPKPEPKDDKDKGTGLYL